MWQHLKYRTATIITRTTVATVTARAPNTPPTTTEVVVVVVVVLVVVVAAVVLLLLLLLSVVVGGVVGVALSRGIVEVTAKNEFHILLLVSRVIILKVHM